MVILVSEEAGETNILETGNGIHPSEVQVGHCSCAMTTEYKNKVPAEYLHKGMANQPDV